jgi:hypothetical protein
MTAIAIRVDSYTLSSVEGLSKLYPEPAARAGHLGALLQRHDTTSTMLSASLRDALTGFLPRIARISRMQKENSSNSRQASQENSLNSSNSTCIDYRFAVCLVIIESDARMAQENEWC